MKSLYQWLSPGPWPSQEINSSPLSGQTKAGRVAVATCPNCPGWDSLQDWALAHSHLESSLCSSEGSGPLHEDCSPLPLPWPQGSFLGLTEENLVGLLEVKPRTVWESPDTVANRSFWPSQESSHRLSHTSASSKCCCQLTSPPAPAPGEQILAWPPTSFVSPGFEVVVCVLLTSQCFQAKLILGCSVFPGFMDECELSKVLYVRAETRSFVL